MIGVIGNGLISGCIQNSIGVNKVFTSKNIHTISENEYDVVYCAAPTSNRIWASKNSDLDKKSVQSIINECTLANIKRFVLVSTGDTQIKPWTTYGQNRLELENFVKQNYINYGIIRLPCLIHKGITKNLLWDIKHKKWLDKINLNVTNQWFDLNNVENYLNVDKEFNVCSEPISNKKIIARFAPEIFDLLDVSKPHELYDLEPYSFTTEEIFRSIENYLK